MATRAADVNPEEKEKEKNVDVFLDFVVFREMVVIAVSAKQHEPQTAANHFTPNTYVKYFMEER